MEINIFWSKFAENKLEEIFKYYSETVSPIFAKKFVFEIINATLILRSKPLIGQKEELLKNRSEEFRYLIHKNYKIIYMVRLNENRIDIIHIFDTRQNPTKIKNL